MKYYKETVYQGVYWENDPLSAETPFGLPPKRHLPRFFMMDTKLYLPIK